MSKFLGSISQSPAQPDEYPKNKGPFPRRRVYGRIGGVAKVKGDGANQRISVVLSALNENNHLRSMWVNSAPVEWLDAAWADFTPKTRSTGLGRYAFWEALVGMYVSCEAEVAPSTRFHAALLRPRHAIAHDLDAAAFTLEKRASLPRGAIAVPLREMIVKHGVGPSLTLKRGNYVTHTDDGLHDIELIPEGSEWGLFCFPTPKGDGWILPNVRHPMSEP